MIQDELWIAQLANNARIEIATSESLWSAFTSQLASRLNLGEKVVQRNIGVWSAHKQLEYIAHLPTGELYLIPPAVQLELAPIEPGTDGYTDDTLVQALHETTGYTLEVVNGWWESIAIVFDRLIKKGNKVFWKNIGYFEPLIDHAGNYDGYVFSPLGEVPENLNKPFSMFSPVLVSSDKQDSKTPVKEVQSWDETDLAPKYYILVINKPEPHFENLPPREVKTQSPKDDHIQPIVMPPTDVSHGRSANDNIGDKKEEATIVAGEGAKGESVNKAGEITSKDAPPAVKSAQKDKPTNQGGDDPKKIKEKKARNVQYILLIILFLVIGTVLYLLFHNKMPNLLHNGSETVVDTTIVTEEPVFEGEIPGDSVKNDSIENEISSMSHGVDSIDQNLKSVEKEIPSSSANYAEKIILKKGDKLTNKALAKYGHKAFWVYIYLENGNIIKDPNNIPAGTKLTLPAAEKYGIDAKNTNSVKKALIIQRDINNSIIKGNY
ncbi:hypothetical protein [Porphyromonas pogonae]|uniref:LysM peptidoglycan-binding domain-containing protein n=1 Tax=Porphyromonas pogonae TaxID=867595 RepID=UPI002E77E002|nr:hypothetical protein [Porphyromonas pogonae]